MTGKISDADKNSKAGSKLNSNMVKISSSKSILSYQNGSALNAENRKCTAVDGMPEEGFAEDAAEPSEDPFTEAQNLKSECLDLLRKKLISDLSLTVFSCDLENKLTKMEPIEISKERQSVIQKLVVQISQLSDAEKLLLYLKLPSSTSSPFDPLRQPLNPLGNRQEIQQTIVWIKTHLEEDSEISIPKQDVYDQYLKYCENVSMKPLSTADFGKVMKQVYPGVRPRRLGTRGNSRYCYSGMRNTCKLPTPILPRSTTENSVASDCTVSSFLSADASKCKKLDKSKRKWTSSNVCQNDKPTGTNRSPCPLGTDKTATCPLKVAKKSKSQREIELKSFKEADDKIEDESTETVDSYDRGVRDIKSEETNLNAIKSEDMGGIKCEDCPNNSYSAFDIDCELRRCQQMSCGSQETGDNFSQSKKQADELSNANSKSKLISPSKGDQTMQTNNSVRHVPDTVNCLDRDKRVVSDKTEPKPKGRRTSSALWRAAKNVKKSSYVPIQPKPAEGLTQEAIYTNIPLEKKKDSDGVATGLCEESDSQEPEEEIVRYFKHLDETEMATNGLVEQAVKHIDNGTVQIRDITQKGQSACYGDGDETAAQINQQLVRSQSCFEDHQRDFVQGEKREPVYVPRSQSSVELPTSGDHQDRQQEVTEPESALSDRKNKVSHLRILLEMSISKTPYSNMKGDSQVGSAAISNAQNAIVDPGAQVDSNYLIANMKPVERDLTKLNGLKGPPLVPQSPNTRTKYFNFTPISPGPQSPLKTSSASPFVSPRVLRSRPNSYNDHFLPPSDRKSGQVRADGPKVDPMPDDYFNFTKNGKTPPNFASGSRPRSYSSINFYRSKARRNSAKPSVLDRTIGQMAKNQIQSVAPAGGFALNPPFSAQQVGQGFPGPGESLSTEVEKFLDNNSTKATESQVRAMIRSRSAPLNRMMSDSGWMSSGQISAAYPAFYNSDESDKLPSSSGSSSKDNLTAFAVGNGDMANLAGEIFPGDPGMVDLSDQYFPGDFQRQAGDNFLGSQSFSEDSAFSSKLDLNSSGTFDSAFASDSDPAAIADNIKSYLPDFEGLDNKGLVEGGGSGEEVVQADSKLFKNALYEGGGENLKDPVITSFKPVLINEMAHSPGSPVLNFFGAKMNEDSQQQLIEFFDFVD